jgi:hypothetical protein
MRAALVLALFLSGCALDVQGPADPPPATESAAPELESPTPSPPSSSPNCAPVLDEKLELTAWLCQPKQIIVPGDDFDQPADLGAPTWTSGADPRE